MNLPRSTAQRQEELRQFLESVGVDRSLTENIKGIYENPIPDKNGHQRLTIHYLEGPREAVSLNISREEYHQQKKEFFSSQEANRSFQTDGRPIPIAGNEAGELFLKGLGINQTLERSGIRPQDVQTAQVLPEVRQENQHVQLSLTLKDGREVVVDSGRTPQQYHVYTEGFSEGFARAKADQQRLGLGANPNPSAQAAPSPQSAQRPAVATEQQKPGILGGLKSMLPILLGVGGLLVGATTMGPAAGIIFGILGAIGGFAVPALLTPGSQEHQDITNIGKGIAKDFERRPAGESQTPQLAQSQNAAIPENVLQQASALRPESSAIALSEGTSLPAQGRGSPAENIPGR